MKAKICGITDSKTLDFIINHNYPPEFIGFICNYPRSHRNLKLNYLKKLINVKNKNGINFVSVLVNPNEKILDEIKKLNFDYVQLYDVGPDKTKFIKQKYKFKIISAVTIDRSVDLKKYYFYKDLSEIILFDSKGYEKSLSFDHKILINIPITITRMLAGNIKYNDKLDNYRKIADIIDISGSLETKGKKDIFKINTFLQNLNKLKIKI